MKEDFTDFIELSGLLIYDPDTIYKINKKNPKKKKSISEKTTLVICYGDSVYSEKKKSIKVFQSFPKIQKVKLFP